MGVAGAGGGGLSYVATVGYVDVDDALQDMCGVVGCVAWATINQVVMDGT